MIYQSEVLQPQRIWHQPIIWHNFYQKLHPPPRLDPPLTCLANASLFLNLQQMTSYKVNKCMFQCDLYFHSIDID